MTVNGPRNHWIRVLSKIEKRYYQKMISPDLLLILRADPEIAVRRKPDESEISVRARSTEVWDTDWQQTRFCMIDANHPKEQVISEVKKIIWSHL
jgi:thymidylate kinase